MEAKYRLGFFIILDGSGANYFTLACEGGGRVKPKLNSVGSPLGECQREISDGHERRGLGDHPEAGAHTRR